MSREPGGSEVYCFGFIEAGEDPKAIRNTLEQALSVKFRKARNSKYPEPDERDAPSYAATHPSWQSWLPGTSDPSKIELKRNRHAAAGYYEFPQHPECDWTLECDIHEKHSQELLDAIAHLDFLRLHSPPWSKLGW